MGLLRRFTNWLRPKMPVLNILLVLAVYIANEYFIQGFCQPVPWVWWVLGPSTGAFLAWPWLKHVRGLNYVLVFLLGVYFVVCVYCTLFIGPHLVIGLLLGFLLFPLLLWLPVVVAVQVIRRVLASRLPGARWVFGAGLLPLLLAQGWAWRQYRQVEAAVATLPLAQRHQAGPLLRVVPRTYMAERLAGQLFKYHALSEMLFDGWRPPLHDPLVNVCMAVGFLAQHDAARTGPLVIESWNYGYGGYRVTDINAQAAFYHKLFPDETLKADCACSHMPDAKTYFAWKPGVTNDQGALVVEVERKRKATEAFLRAQADSAAANGHSSSRP